MQLAVKLGFLLITSCFLSAQSFDDPVMNIRIQRAQAQGINEADLPPVPKAIMTPPPLPEPELHIKDSFAYSTTRIATPKKLNNHLATKTIRLKHKSKFKQISKLQLANKIVTSKRASRLAIKTAKINVDKNANGRKYNKSIEKITKKTHIVHQSKTFGKVIFKPIKKVNLVKKNKK